MRYPSNGLVLVSLFAGCGGSSLGYRMAGYDVRLAVEWDAAACATYRANFPGACVYEGDICALADAEALRLARVAVGGLDVLDGSPPCQGFSTAGARRFGDSRNLLFREYVRLLSAFQPRAFVMENVSGLAKGKMRIAFAEMTRALKRAGYRVSCRLLNAWWYGVPQDRKRLIWIGLRDDVPGDPSHPAPTVSAPVTIGEALGYAGTARNAQFRNKWRSSALPSPTLQASAPPMIECGSGYSRAYFRGRIAATIASQRRTRIIGGGNVARPITDDEAKTLQGFPPWFTGATYRQIGNSVPPPMAEAVGRHVAQLLLAVPIPALATSHG